MTDKSNALSRRFARLTPAVTALAVAVSVALVPLAGPASAETVTARTLLSRLAVAPESNTGYDRTLFKHWVDADGDCQNTRAEVLVAESRVAPKFTTTRKCTVSKGKWVSPWDGVTWTLASDVDVDHHVPLAEAWGAGASAWTSADRQRYANDLYGPALNAMTDNLNSSKGDRDPAEWLPPKTSTRCTYAIYWVQVKYRWTLSMDSTERSQLSSILSGTCGDRAVVVPARAR